MKKLFVSIGMLMIAGIAANGQCHKKIIWASDKTEYLDSTGKIQDVKTQPTVVEITPAHITVTLEEEHEVIQGEIKDLTCEWKDPFKNGKTSFKSLMAKSNGETKNVKIAIEGKEGRINIVFEVEQMDGRKMRLLVKSFREEI